MYSEYAHESAYQSRGDYGRPGTAMSDGKRMRKPVQRRTVDYSPPVVKLMQTRMHERDIRDSSTLQPTAGAALNLLPPVAYPDNPSTSFCTKFVHASTNKVRCSINRVVWTPTGRRLITGSQSGEFTLWNGQSFNFEMILQAHDVAIRSMVWSNSENWLVTGDDAGCIKYWQSNMNNVKAKQGAHKEAVRDLSFSSTDLKFASCSDDTTVKVWDFALCQEESALSGHGWDVKSVDWHPTKSLLVSGAKDNLVKLWDAKSGRQLCTLHGHKNTVLSVKWNKNGNWLLSASRDQLIKLYDLRMLKELESYRGHKKEVTALAWHPHHEELFVSGGYEGSILHWVVGQEQVQAEVATAHESSVWTLAWHPVGHILCSGSNDHSTKFWCRSRPGEAMKDWSRTQPTDGAPSELASRMEIEEQSAAIPGLGLTAAAPAAAPPPSAASLSALRAPSAIGHLNLPSPPVGVASHPAGLEGTGPSLPLPPPPPLPLPPPPPLPAGGTLMATMGPLLPTVQQMPIGSLAPQYLGMHSGMPMQGYMASHPPGDLTGQSGAGVLGMMPPMAMSGQYVQTAGMMQMTGILPFGSGQLPGQ